MQSNQTAHLYKAVTKYQVTVTSSCIFDVFFTLKPYGQNVNSCRNQIKGYCIASVYDK